MSNLEYHFKPETYYDPEIELSVLSAMTMSQANAIEYSSKLSADDFKYGNCSDYFKSIKSLVDTQKSVDKISILNLMKQKNHDREKVFEISDFISSDKNIKTYVSQLKDITSRRKLLALGDSIRRQVNDSDKSTMYE